MRADNYTSVDNCFDLHEREHGLLVLISALLMNAILIKTIYSRVPIEGTTKGTKTQTLEVYWCLVFGPIKI